jgi:L-ascorbate metabolism protein UlaG (beta-lactamase superfamily)
MCHWVSSIGSRRKFVGPRWKELRAMSLPWTGISTLSIRGKTDAMELHFLAVQHWSARSLGDRYETLWGSWAVIHPTFRFWFSGDLGYSPDTRDIGERMGGFDLAAIAIGAYEPRWFMKDSHLNPQEALQVMQDVNAKAAVGIHWGTFEGISDEPLDQAPKDLEIAKTKLVAPKNFFRVEARSDLGQDGQVTDASSVRIPSAPPKNDAI